MDVSLLGYGLLQRAGSGDTPRPPQSVPLELRDELLRLRLIAIAAGGASMDTLGARFHRPAK